MPPTLENSAVATGLEKVSFHSNPKEGNAKECSNYHTIVLISHASKVKLNILQAKLQQSCYTVLLEHSLSGGFLFFHILKPGAVIVSPVHPLGPHGQRTYPETAFTVKRTVNHHGLQGFRMLRHIQKPVEVALEMAVNAGFQLAHSRSFFHCTKSS